MSERAEFGIRVREDKNVQFFVDFDSVIPELRTGEPSSLGQDAGPKPAAAWRGGRELSCSQSAVLAAQVQESHGN